MKIVQSIVTTVHILVETSLNYYADLVNSDLLDLTTCTGNTTQPKLRN